MKLKAFKARPKRDASPTRGKHCQETSGSGTGNSKGSDTEFTSAVSSHQTFAASTMDPTKDYDIKARADSSLNKRVGKMSSTGITLTSDALIEDSAGSTKSESSDSTVGSNETMHRRFGDPGPDAVDASYRAFDHVELSPHLKKLKSTDFAAFKMEELRFELDCQAVYRSAEHPSEQHPNHPRVWAAKNLWCSTCTKNCAVCGASCCARNQALEVISSTASSLDEKAKAQQRVDRIQRWITVSMDETTFLTCTECHCLVCPSCCGLCPDPICRDLTCKKCKEDPWARCDWH